MPSGVEDVLAVLCWAYVAGLASWAMLRFIFGDRLHILFFINALAHLFFLPAPVLLLVAVATVDVALIVLTAGQTLVFVVLWVVPYLRPLLRSRVFAAGDVLRVATYNMLWVNEDSTSAVAAIQASDADVVALQEVSPAHAKAIELELANEYPYRIIEPRPKAYGNGMISRLPLSACPGAIPDSDWIGEPIVANVRFADQEVTAISCHAAPVRMAAASRERQSRALLDFAAQAGQPFVLMGDFNSTPMHVAHRILARSMRDVWPRAGRGLGHTFPGRAWSRAQGDGLPKPLRRFVPPWLMRIDHVFVTDHWQPVSARVARSDGSSDHRPLVVELRLRDKA
jgi:vancomycin resistance protein VanJ